MFRPMPVASELAHASQLLLDDCGTPLSGATFVIIDLETSGASPASAGITEVGAVKVRGGQVIGSSARWSIPATPFRPSSPH